jgi:predicted kinase
VNGAALVKHVGMSVFALRMTDVPAFTTIWPVTPVRNFFLTGSIPRKYTDFMPKIYATIGLPGCGKSTLAEKRCADGSGRRANRDDIRFDRYGVYFGPPIDENIVTKIQDDLVADTLAAGLDVWIDDTNLTERAKRHINRLAEQHNVPVVWIDLTHVPLETCITRDENRARRVGEEVILSMYDRFIRPIHAGTR